MSGVAQQASKADEANGSVRSQEPVASSVDPDPALASSGAGPPGGSMEGVDDKSHGADSFGGH